MTVNQGFVEAMIVLAEGHMDQLLQNDGMEVNLEEDPNLELPYVVPHMGYSCDSIQGLPIGLQDFLEPMISAGTYTHGRGTVVAHGQGACSSSFIFCWDQGLEVGVLQ